MQITSLSLSLFAAVHNGDSFYEIFQNTYIHIKMVLDPNGKFYP